VLDEFGKISEVVGCCQNRKELDLVKAHSIVRFVVGFYTLSFWYQSWFRSDSFGRTCGCLANNDN